MKDKILCLLFVLTVIFGVFAMNSTFGNAYALNGSNNVIYVSDSIGNDNNTGLTPEKPKKTIKNATDTVTPDGTVVIANGHYSGEKNYNVTLNKNMAITGQSRDDVVLDAQKQGQIFTISKNILVSMSDLTLINGKYEAQNESSCGGGVLNNGGLELKNCLFKDNRADNGQAIFNNGHCIIIECKFQNNTNQEFTDVIMNEGRLDVFRCDLSGYIFTNGSCNIQKSYLTGSNGWSGIRNWYGTLNVKNSIFTGNNKGNSGIVNARSGSCVIEDCIFKDNKETGYGGSVLNHASSCMVKNSVFINNKQITGGAISNQVISNEERCNCTVMDCDFTGNTATGVEEIGTKSSGFGGAIISIGKNTYLNIYRCNFNDNTAKFVPGSENPSTGGAIGNELGICNITGCTFIGNSADEGGAISNEYEGACVLHFNRFVRNSAVNGCAVFSENGSVDALYNWWGSNKGPTGLNKGKVSDNSWLLLTIKAETSKIRLSESIRIIANLYMDSQGHNHHAESKNYPPMIPVVFKSTWGTVTQNNVKYGTSSTKFTAKGVNPPKYVLISAADSSSPLDTVISRIDLDNPVMVDRTVGMKDTGLPLLLLFLGVLMLLGGYKRFRG